MKGMNRALHKDSYFHKSICLPITSKYRDKIEDTNEKLKDKSVNFIKFQMIFFSLVQNCLTVEESLHCKSLKTCFKKKTCFEKIFLFQEKLSCPFCKPNNFNKIFLQEKIS